MKNYSQRALEVQKKYGFSPRKSLEFVMELSYHGADTLDASLRAEEASDRYHRETCQEVSERLRDLRDHGMMHESPYSFNQLSSVITLLGWGDMEDMDGYEVEELVYSAEDLIRICELEFLDWSEASWEEIYSHLHSTFMFMQREEI